MCSPEPPRPRGPALNLNPCRAYPGRRFCAVVDIGASGLSAMINAGAALEHEVDSIQVIEIGRPATAPEQDFTMQVCGRFLSYTIALYGPQIHLSAQPMDVGDPPDLLLRTGDNENGWQTVRGVIAALETHGITSLARPIKAWDGYDGANGFVIG